MGARRKKPVVHLPGSPANTDVDPSDVTAQTHPEGVPTNPDGSVSTAVTEMPIDTARGIGALGAESAQRNKGMARRIDRRAKGETGVSFNEDNAIVAFDMVKATYGPSTVLICIKNLDTQVDLAPQRMAKFRASDELYTHVLANHRRSPQARYEILFKDVGTWQIRHKSYLVMPDTLDDAATPAAPQQQVFGLPTYPGVNSIPYGAPAPYPGAMPPPQQPAPAAAAPPPAQPPPAGLDPVVAQLFAELRALREVVGVGQMQSAAVYGGLEEFKRQQAQMAAAAAMPQPQVVIPPAPAPAAAPSPPPVEPYRPAGPPAQQVQFLGMDPTTGRPLYGIPYQPATPAAAAPAPQPQVQQPPPPQGFGAIPPPPAPKPVDPVQQVLAAVAQAASMKKAIDAAARSLGGGVAAPEPDEPAPAPEPEALPITAIPMGAGEDPPNLAVNTKDGSINWGATFMGNAHRLPGILDHMARSVGNLNRQMTEAQSRRPITVHATEVGPMPVRAAPAPVIPIPPRP